ncbi:MAG: TonB-dependent receptor [Alphaproteobacteria bacterium]
MPVNLGPESVDRARPQFGSLLLRGASAIALCAFGVVGIASPAHAQAATGTTSTTTSADGTTASSEDTIVVTGVRASLRNAQQIKRDADTVVDSITATDIGAFPDKSVAEALQRVAGITVNRFAASDDTAHFSAEPSGVIVRGLPQVRSEFNGRDSFSANSSRGLSWSDISPELMSGVDTYKNQTAELIEGGLAGSINMRTRVPFDSPGRSIAFTFRENYGDITQRWTPEASGFVSDRWMTGLGEFGAMLDYAYSHVDTASQGVFFGRMGKFSGYDTGLGNSKEPGPAIQYIPSSINYRDNDYDRVRNGFAGALQWQDPDHKFLATVQYNRSNYENEWHEHVVSSFPADIFYGQGKNYVVDASNVAAPQPMAGTDDFTFDQSGLFQHGTMTDDIGWWGSGQQAATGYAQNSAGQPITLPCYNNGDNNWGSGPLPYACSTRRAPEIGTSTRFNHNEDMTEDGSFNLKWDATDRLRFNFDYQHVHSTVSNYDMTIDLNSFAVPTLDLTGKHPSLTLTTPDPTVVNTNLDAGGLSTPSNYYYHDIMDHLENSEGDEDAARIDMQYSINSDWLDAIRVGYRWADRQQTVRWSTYNWQNVANNWSCNYFIHDITQGPMDVNGSTDPALSACGYTGPNFHFNGFPQDAYSLMNFGNDAFFKNNLAPHQFVFANMDLVENFAKISNTLSDSALGIPSSFTGWDPICSNIGDRASEIPGTCYRQVEIADVDESTQAAYIMIKFGGENATIAGMRVSGNIGVRYVETEDKSTGGVSIGSALSGATTTCTLPPPAAPPPPPNSLPGSIGCYLSADDIAFNNGAQYLSTADATHHNLLPSFNLKLDLTDTWVLRFAASRAMSRPDMGYLKNYLGVSGPSFPSTSDASDPRWIKNSSGVVVGVNPTYTATAFNPYLAPTTADGFDLSLENYFSDVGSFSLAVFYKKFHNYINGSNARYDIPVTNNGVTRTVEVTGPVNSDGGSIQGGEISYQRFLDFLPGALSGLGVQANFTYIENKGISNNFARIVSGDGTATTTNAGNPDVVNTNWLEGLSKYSYNLVGMYEHGPWAARLAYNWRSKWLVTRYDCCVYLPVWQMAAGYLDGSVRYRINDRLELSLEGSNLLNTETVLKQQVTDAPGETLMPNAWIQQDRRFVAGVRLRF